MTLPALYLDQYDTNSILLCKLFIKEGGRVALLLVHETFNPSEA